MAKTDVRAVLRWKQAVRTYQRHRETPHRDSLCNAPRTNLYFTVDGQVAPCWRYFPEQVPRWGQGRSILDIWQGPEFERVRRAIADERFVDQCAQCEHEIATGNRPLAAAYDNEHPIGEWPTMLELELSNRCNLECVMCNGQLSSLIRKNREQRPPLESPYDERFVEQVAELLPHLHEVRFNGGEPFLHPIVHRIGARIAATRPDLKITVATNGTVINDKVRRMLAGCNVHINLSIDSLVPERYAAIRVNGDLDRVMAHFAELKAYCADGGRDLCIMVNPMRMNWMEMNDYVWWTAEHGVRLWFNTIKEPAHLALHSLPADELAAIHEEMAAKPLPVPPDGPTGRVGRANDHVYASWLHQVATWRDEARSRAPRRQAAQVEIRSHRP